MFKAINTLRTPTTEIIANNTVYQIIGKLVSLAITVFTTFIITRMYGRFGYGEFNLMQNIPALFFVIVDFGINAIATKDLTADFSKARHYILNILLLRIVFSAVAMLILFISVNFLSYSADLKLGLFLASFLILTQSLYTTLNIIFQVKQRYDYSTFGYVIGSLVVLLLVLILSYLRVSIKWVNFSYVLGGFITFFVNLFFVSKYFSFGFNIKIDKLLWKSLLIQSLPLGIMFIFSQINFKIDSILLSIQSVPAFLNLTKTDATALYGLPYKIFEVCLVIPTFFMNAVYPVFVRHLNISHAYLKKTFFKVLATLGVVSLLCSLIGILFSAFAISLLGGPAFTQSVLVLRVLLLGLPIFFLTQPISWLIVTLNKQKYLPITYFISSLINVGLNLYFIPKYSFYASAVITSISEVVVLLLLIYFAKKSWRESILNA